MITRNPLTYNNEYWQKACRTSNLKPEYHKTVDIVIDQYRTIDARV